MKRLALITAVLGLLSACGGTAEETTTGPTPTEAPTTTTAVPTTSLGPDAVIDPGDGGDYSIDLTAADFVTRIDNPYLPFAPGARWVYQEDGQHIEVTVLTDTREIMGVTATVVRDTVTEDGQVIEDTYDWYAQDIAGNVWYLGEDTTTYENGTAVSREGSWEWGVDGALPGIVMPASPAVGDAYRQEYYRGHAEDLAAISRIGDSASTPYGEFTGLLVTTEWTPLSPDQVEEKYYAAGIGMVFERVVRGDPAEARLVEFTPGG